MICEPPTPSSGRMATDSTMRPMPPIHERKQRQPFSDTGSLSSPVKTVAPVVVRQDIISK